MKKQHHISELKQHLIASTQRYKKMLQLESNLTQVEPNRKNKKDMWKKGKETH